MEKYNGWRNYETWLFNLNYGDYLREEYQDLKELEPELDAVEFVENFIESILIDDLPKNMPSFFSDILRTVVDSVDVEEIAESLLED